MKESINIIKIGGNVIDHPEMQSTFLDQFSSLKGHKILVHGGGKIATRLSAELGNETTMIAGRRVTSHSELDVVTMVYAGLINKRLVAALQAKSCNALGLSGADGNSILSEMRNPVPIDYGFAGDVVAVNQQFFQQQLVGGITPVVCAITHDGTGNLLNTNADTIASKLAIALSEVFDVTLTYCFEKAGVLESINDEQSVIESIDRQSFEKLKNDGIITDGMLPKLENCLQAVEQGVLAVCILSPDNLHKEDAHTTISAQ